MTKRRGGWHHQGVEPKQEIAVVRWIAFACVVWIGYFVTATAFFTLHLAGYSIPNTVGTVISIAVGLIAAIWYSRRQRRRAFAKASASA